MVWIIQTRLRLNVCNKEVNNVTMNNLLCNVSSTLWSGVIHIHYLLNLTKSDSFVNHMTIKKKKRQVPTINSFNLDMHYETLFP